MSTLRALSERIRKEIKIENHDVQGEIRPNIRELRAASQASLELLIQRFHDWKNVGTLRKLPKTQLVFEEVLLTIKDDIDQHGRWSFWHYSTLCLITCFAYLKLIEQEKNKTLKLQDPAVWDSHPWESAVLTINFVAGVLHPTALSRLQSIAQSDDVDIRDMCKTLIWHMNKLN